MDQLTRGTAVRTPVDEDPERPANGRPPEPFSRRRVPLVVRRRWFQVLLVVLIVSVVAAVLVIQQNQSDDTPAGGAAGKTGTTTVSRRDLAVTEDVKGDLGYGDQRNLSAQRSGVVTALAAVGKVVKQGQTLYSVDLERAVLLTGDVPAYRPLSVDSSAGDDVRQLEKALVKLGYGDDLTVDRNFTSATADAVEDWEKDLGRDDPDGTVKLGDVVFAPGSVRVSSQPLSVGTQVQATTTVLAISSTVKVANVDLDLGKSDLVAPKDVVNVSLPNGKDTKGIVASVGTDPQTGDADPTADPTVPLVVTLSTPKDAAGLDSGSVTVSIEQSRDDDVLAVPVTALLSLAEGGYALEVVDPARPSGHRLLAVTIGTVTDDYVGISGAGVTEGLEVVVPE